MNQLFTEEMNWSTPFLAGMTYSRQGGRVRGGVVRGEGALSPEADCIMFTRDKVGFCRVCQRAISRVIDMYAR